MQSFLRRLDAWLEPVLPLSEWEGAGASGSVEFGQSVARIVLGSVSALALMPISLVADVPRALYELAAAFMAYAVLHSFWVYRYPEPLRIRRAITLGLDNLMTCYFASFGGVFAVYATILFWTTVGYGLRFGARYLFIASALAIGGMAYNVIEAPYWQEHTAFGITIILSLIAMTASTALVFKRISSVSRQLVAQNAEIVRLARHDPLTGIPNRRYLFERLAETTARAQRGAQRYALLLFDVDEFKEVNDALGHDAGDELLREISNRITCRVRQSDTFARLGGDEFVIILENIPQPSDAMVMATSVLQIVRGIECLAAGPVHVSASLGIAIGDPSHSPAQSPVDLLRSADAAMYEAKRAGGNCALFSTAPDMATTAETNEALR